MICVFLIVVVRMVCGVGIGVFLSCLCRFDGNDGKIVVRFGDDGVLLGIL